MICQDAPDGDAPKMPDDVDPAALYDAPVISGDTPVMPDVVDPVILVADAPMTPGAYVLMIPDVGAPEIPGDTTPRSGWHLGVFLGILITQFSSSENSAGCSGDGVDSSGRDDDVFCCCSDLSAFSCSVRLILARRFSSSFSGESKIVKSRPVPGGSAPNVPLACALLNVSSTLRLDLVLAAS